MFNSPLWVRFKRDLPGSLIIGLILLFFWFLISASLDWQHIFTGIVLAFLTVLIWNLLTINEHGRSRITWRQVKIVLRYFIFLLTEVVKANFIVASIVLNPRLPISPGLIVLKVTLKKDLARVLYANSITLTPGTITVDLDEDRLLVHGMTKDHAFGVRSWYMYDIMKDLEESAEK